MISFEAVRNYEQSLFAKITQLPLVWQKSHHSGDTIDRIVKARTALNTYSQDNFENIYMFVKIFASIVAISLISLPSGLMLVVVGTVVVTVILAFDRVIIRGVETVNRKEHAVASTVHDYVTNIVTVITLRLEKLAQTEVARKIFEKYEPFRRLVVVNEWKWFAISMIMAAGNFTLLSLYVYGQVNAGTLLVGNFTMMFQYIMQINGGLFEVAWRYDNITKLSTHVRAVDPLLADHARLAAHEQLPLVEKWQVIDIRGLNFVHPSEDPGEPHLSDIALSLKRGQKIALVGESGSGKSTLLVLLRGLIEPDSAVLLVDGKPQDRLKALMNLSTLIPQEPEIFDNSIEYNIAAGSKQREEDIVDAARLAVFDEVVEALPHRYQTHINEKGVNLSGGQKQRLALARGIFAAEDSSLILLDEPTSSVDPVNELKIYRNLFRHFASRCIISSVHRLHLLPMFDHIYVLDQGRVIEQGSFAELLKTEGRLSAMWADYQVNLATLESGEVTA